MLNIEYIKQKKIIQFFNNTSSLLLALLTFLLPLLYIDILRDPSSLPRYAMYGVSSGIILSLILITKYAENKPSGLSITLFSPILIFLVWSWLSYIWSIDPKNSLLELIQLTGGILIAYSITQLHTQQLLKSLVIPSVAGGTIAAAIGLAQYFDYNPFNYLQFSVPSSTFTNPNIATTYLDLITPLAFFSIFIANNRSLKLLAVLSSILCLSFLLLSHSRGSWLSLIVVLIGFMLLLYKNFNFKNTFIPLLKQHKLHLFTAILIPFLLLSIPLSVSTQPVKNSQIAFDGSIKIRLHAYINSLSILKDHPVTGTGYGSFKTEFRNYMFTTVPFLRVTEDNVLARLHSDPLQFFVELGFIGGLLFIYIYIRILQACWNIIKTTNNPKQLLLTSGIFLAIIANGIHACVDFPFHKPSSALQFWVWVGVIIALSGKVIPSKMIHTNKLTILLLIIFGLVFSAYNYNYYQNYISASQYRLIAENSIRTGSCNSAQINADKMMDAFDDDFRHQSLYVAIYSKCDIDVKEKLFAMNRVLNYDQTNTRAYITRGSIYLLQKSTQNAVNDFLQVTRILPHRASGFIGLAYASLQNNNLSSAIKLLKYALTVEPENTLAKNLLDEINDHK